MVNVTFPEDYVDGRSMPVAAAVEIDSLSTKEASDVLSELSATLANQFIQARFSHISESQFILCKLGGRV